MALFGKDRASRKDARRQDHALVDPRSGLTQIEEVNDGQENRLHQAVANQSSVTPEMYPEPNSVRDADKGEGGATPERQS